MAVAWMEEFVALAHRQLRALDPAHPARAYLRERGVRDEWLTDYQLGFIEAPPTLSTCSPDFWDWLKRYGWNRIIFPLTGPFGDPLGVQARSLGDKGYQNFVLKPRELYTPVFGLHTALPAMYRDGRAVLVEGVFDYFALRPYADDVLCTLTANVTNAVKRLLARYVSLAVCVYDMDKTGRRGAYKLAGLPVPPEYRLPEDVSQRVPASPPFQVIFQPYSEHDPDDLRKAGKTSELLRLVSPQVNPVFAWTHQ